MYDISIDYTTGDSFGSENLIEPLSVPVSDIEIARENLKRIKEHYKKYSGRFLDFGEAYELELLTGNGTHTIIPFWIGYFETLHGAAITTTKDERDVFYT